MRRLSPPAPPQFPDPEQQEPPCHHQPQSHTPGRRTRHKRPHGQRYECEADTDIPPREQPHLLIIATRGSSLSDGNDQNQPGCGRGAGAFNAAFQGGISSAKFRSDRASVCLRSSRLEMTALLGRANRGSSRYYDFDAGFHAWTEAG